MPLHAEMEEPGFHQIFDAQHHLGVVDRLADKVLGPARERTAAGGDRHVGGEDEDGEVFFGGNGRLELLHDLESGEVRHIEVDEDDVGGVFEKGGESLAGVRDSPDVGKAGNFQHAFEESDVGRLIVHDQDFRGVQVFCGHAA